MSNAIQVFLEMQGVEMLEGDVWGHRKDLDEYFTVEDSTLEEICALAAGGASADDVANHIQRTARIGSELIKYIGWAGDQTTDKGARRNGRSMSLVSLCIRNPRSAQDAAQS